MEAASLAFSAAQTLLSALQCPQLKDICSIWNYESELESLQGTVSTINSVLLAADAKEKLSDQEKNFVDRLKPVVYDADDLLDKFTTLAEQHQHLTKGGKVSKKVRLLFRHFGKLGVLYKMSQEVKVIRKKLDAIADDANKFCFKINDKPIRSRREEECSYVYAEEVIGRDKEVNEIINLLLAPISDVQRNVSFGAIVGMGGIGKTTLAQLVYSNDRVKNEFPLKLWACVGDQDNKPFDERLILAKILESATKEKDDGSGKEVVQGRLQERLQGKKYLLILDDVWTEDPMDWDRLKKYLMGGARGSWVLVTTRSQRTAEVVKNDHLYELKGLTPENSWFLFQKIAFKEKDGTNRPP